MYSCSTKSLRVLSGISRALDSGQRSMHRVLSVPRSRIQPEAAHPAPPHSCCRQGRAAHTVERQAKEGFFKSFIKKMGWMDHKTARMKLGGYFLYEGVTDTLDYAYWFEECQLPNTFLSWFVVTELHVWLLSVRCMGEGAEGRILRNSIIEALWADVSERMRQLGISSASEARKQVISLSDQFQAALVGYDEGLLSEDHVLASVVWRRFLQKDSQDARNVENIVRYIRKQILLLEMISRDELFSKPTINWIPLKDASSK